MDMKKTYLIIGLIIILVVFLQFYLLKSYYSVESSKQTEDLVVKFETSDTIHLNNKLPISDTLGKTLTGKGMEEGIQGYLKFSIENKTGKNQKYTILVFKETVDSKELDGNYVKFYLTDQNDQPFEGFAKNVIPNYAGFSASSKKPAARVIYTGVIGKNKSQSFRLRMWVSDNYAFTSDLEEFLIKIDVL